METKHRRDRLRTHHSDDQKAQKHPYNPYTLEYKVSVKRSWRLVRSEGHDMIELATEDRRPMEMKVPIYEEADPFIKLSRRNLAKLGILSLTARRVLDFAMYQLLPNNAVVWLPADEALYFTCFKQAKSFYDGVMELIAYELLAKTEKQGFYYVNPDYFFNGSRKNISNHFYKPTTRYERPTEEA